MKYSKAVKKSFGRAAPLYEARADFQEEAAEELLSLVTSMAESLSSSKSIKILDAGCGTARLMRSLSGNLVVDASLFGLDIALPMLLEAVDVKSSLGVEGGQRGARRGANQGKARFSLINGACEGLPFSDAVFDLIISNLAYQWVRDLPLAFAEVERVLRPGGGFVFSTLGPATLNELQSSLVEADIKGGSFAFTPFAAIDRIEAALEGAGLRLLDIKKKTLLWRYNRPLHLLTTLKKTGASPRGRIIGGSLSKGTFLRRVMRIYEKKFVHIDGGIAATYEVLFVNAEKRA